MNKYFEKHTNILSLNKMICLHV